MTGDQPNLFSLLGGAMDLLSQRQRLLAENIANANTPGYVPQDINQNSFDRLVDAASQPRTGGFSGRIEAQTIDAPDSETTIDGNAVVVEEQIVKVSDNRVHYEAVTAAYQKAVDIMSIAISSPRR